jgi:sulfoxide reductase heme-binding subunit YedZ
MHDSRLDPGFAIAYQIEPTPGRHTISSNMYAFLYAVIHVIINLDLDYGLAWSLLVQEVVEKPRILAGMAAFLMFIPLAATSFDVWKRRLGRNWKRLHQVVYFIAPLVVLHYVWSKKGDLLALQGEVLKPLLYGLAFAVLLVLRLPAVRRGLSALRDGLRARLARRRSLNPGRG